MARYSLRLVNRDEVIVQIYECEYRNALDALEAAKLLSSGGAVEVWSDTARIASIKKGKQPPAHWTIPPTEAAASPKPI